MCWTELAITQAAVEIRPAVAWVKRDTLLNYVLLTFGNDLYRL